jgi:hypothetical protein
MTRKFLLDSLRRRGVNVTGRGISKLDLLSMYQAELEKERRLALGTNDLGHKWGTQAAELDRILADGTSLENAAQLVNSTVSRVRSHIRHLVREKKVRVVVTKEVGKRGSKWRAIL